MLTHCTIGCFLGASGTLTRHRLSPNVTKHQERSSTKAESHRPKCKGHFVSGALDNRIAREVELQPPQSSKTHEFNMLRSQCSLPIFSPPLICLQHPSIKDPHTGGVIDHRCGRWNVTRNGVPPLTPLSASSTCVHVNEDGWQDGALEAVIVRSRLMNLKRRRNRGRM